MKKELRLGVVMSGGVSLAIWMGGVAAEILRLRESPERYMPGPFEDGPYDRVVIDVIAGTSAGGLNGVLLAAALAWGIGADKFASEVRDLWLESASMEDLLRSPWERDPPSLFDGDGIFLPRIEELLASWQPSDKKDRRGLDHPLTLVVTTTLLDPEVDAYYDSLGTKLVEPTHAGTVTFRNSDLTQDAAPQRLALAARATSSFPVAFEPAVLQIGKGDAVDMKELANFSSTRAVVDGGVLLNRPFKHAFDAIVGQPATGPVRRVVLYVVPDPKPLSNEANAPEGAKITVPVVLGKVAKAGFAQSLSEDLKDWRTHALQWRRQQDQRYWLAQLSANQRAELVKTRYQAFLDQRAASSARYTVTKLLDDSDTWAEGMNWRRLYDQLLLGRMEDDWRPEQLPDSVDLTGCWQWGLASVEYFADVITDLMKGAAGPCTPLFRHAVNHVARAMAGYRRVDREYWKWAVLAKSDGNPIEWGKNVYEAWPCIAAAPGTATADEKERKSREGRVDDAIAAINDAYAEAARILGEDETAIKLRREFAPRACGPQKVAPPPTGPTQDDYRHHLSEVARLLARIYMLWRNTVYEAGTSEPIDKVVDAINDTSQVLGDPPPESIVIHNLLTFMVIQVANQPHALVPEQPIELVQVSADTPNALAPKSFFSAADKLTGIQLGHFGGFYKKSWRANDWMWGRLDGIQRLAEMGHVEDEALDPTDRAPATTKQEAIDHLREDLERWDQREARAASATVKVEELQVSALAEELPRLARAITSSEDRGGKVHPHASDFKERLAEHPISNTSTPEEVGRLLRSLRIASETIVKEAGSDQFTRVVTRTAAVSGNLLSGSAGGIGPLKHLFSQIRNLVLMPFYLLASNVTSGSRTGAFLTGSTLVIALTFILSDFLFDATVPGWLLGLAWVVLSFWALYAISRTAPPQRMVIAATTALLFAVLGMAIVVDWAGVPVPTGARVVLSCEVTPEDIVVVPVTGEPSRVTVEGCVATDPRNATNAEDRAHWIRLGLQYLGPVMLVISVVLGFRIGRRWEVVVTEGRHGLSVWLGGLCLAISAASLVAWRDVVDRSWLTLVALALALISVLALFALWPSDPRQGRPGVPRPRPLSEERSKFFRPPLSTYLTGLGSGVLIGLLAIGAVVMAVAGTPDAATLVFEPNVPSGLTDTVTWLADHRPLAAVLAIALPAAVGAFLGVMRNRG